MALLLSVGVEAKTIISQGWSAWDSEKCTVSGNVLTFHEAWSGANIWFDPVQDWNSIDKLVIKFAEETEGDFKFYVQLSDNTSSTQKTVTSNSLITAIDINTDANIKNKLNSIRQIVTQSQAANCKFVIEEIYLGTNAEYTADVTATRTAQKSFWGLGQYDLNTGWPSEAQVTAGTAQTASTYDISTKTITIGKTSLDSEWNGKGWYWGNKDFSNFDQIVIKFEEETTSNGQIVIDYATEGEGIDGIHAFDSGVTTVVANLKSTYKNNVTQIYIQAPVGATFKLKDAYSVRRKAHISTIDYATYSVDDALDFTGLDVKAYIATEVNGSAITLKQVNTVPANTGLILIGTAGEDYTIPVIASSSTVTNNHMVAVPYKTTITSATAGDNYVLSVDNSSNPIFAKVDNDLYPATVGAGKAYLHFDVVGPSRTLTFNIEDETTGISTMHNSQCIMNNEYYDLSGRRVALPTKGLYIVNGKKVIIK